ncbi:unnamed protein product, partial [Brenthis ino]
MAARDVTDRSHARGLVSKVSHESCSASSRARLQNERTKNIKSKHINKCIYRRVLDQLYPLYRCRRTRTVKSYHIAYKNPTLGVIAVW